MDTSKRSDYDDMSPGSYGPDFNEKRHKLMKRLVSSIILLFVAASIVGIVVLLRSPDRLSVSETQLTAPDITIGVLDTDDLIDAEAHKILEEKLSDEQKKAVDLTKEAYTGTEESISETVSDTGEASDETSTNLPESASTADSAATSETTSPENPETIENTETESEEESPVENDSDANGNADIQNSPVKFFDYVVKTGDTVNKIAASYGLFPETIVGVNEIDDINQIVVGSVLQIPDRDGQVYTVKTGDTLSEIAFSFGMKLYTPLADVNSKKSALIKPGEKLFIPIMISEEEFLYVMNSLFVLPVEGLISIHFNDEIEDMTTGEMKITTGLYIENSIGTTIAAAKSGQISEIGSDQSGLGKYMVLSHDNGYESVYGHLDNFFGLELGDFVEQNEQIAELGSTGNIYDPMLYFEIRKDMIPIDPEQFF